MTILATTERNGYIYNIPARWHDGPTPSAWTTTEKFLALYRRFHKQATLDEVKDIINKLAYAEQPLEIYEECEDQEPWKHNGLLVKQIPYGWDPCFY